jgi:UDP-N-acetylmuramoyl-L-alanyl-D-glutamate--2,6-diaminopimelate ligase
MDAILTTIKRMVPTGVLGAVLPLYHHLLVFAGALRYNFPSRSLKVIGVTGTKGKSTTVELLRAIFDEAGYMTASTSTIRFTIGDETRPNLYKMSMPGRFFMQRFLAEARDKGVQYAIIEMTSEGAKQFRHRYIELDALVFTNITPEHIESHGSFEKYLAAKLMLRDSLNESDKSPRFMVANRDDPHGSDFLQVEKGVTGVTFSLKDAEPYAITDRGVLFTFEGMSIHSPLIGQFNLYNLLAAATLARVQGISLETIKKALEKTSLIKGRVEKIDEGQKFTAVVDYAHTPESLEALYLAFPNRRIIGVLGNTGGGRDTWKRPVMAGIAEKYCTEIILTNEDPYDEDPEAILREMQAGMKEKKPTIILDRRAAIRHALSLANDRDVVLVSGKGTDPYIMGPRGEKTPWSDEKVVREELRKLLKKDDS